MLGVLLVLAQVEVLLAQVNNDSLPEDFRALAAKNFSRYRTVNFSWEMKPTTITVSDWMVRNRKRGASRPFTPYASPRWCLS